MSGPDERKGLSGGGSPEPAGEQAQEVLSGEWREEPAAAGEGEEEWVDEDKAGWDEEEPASAAKPKDGPPWVTWVSGLAGLAIGLLLFRSCE